MNTGAQTAPVPPKQKSELLNDRINEIGGKLHDMSLRVQNHRNKLLGQDIAIPTNDPGQKTPPYEPSFVNDLLLKLDEIENFIRNINGNLSKIEEF